MRITSSASSSVVIALFALLAPISFTNAQAYPQVITTNGDTTSSIQYISADGRYVAFNSGASDLVPDDTNGTIDVFVYDTMTNETTRVSVASDGTEGNGDVTSSGISGSGFPSISADGKYVAFHSAASNLAPADTNGMSDVFVHNMLTGETKRASVASDGTGGNGVSASPSVSTNGRVAFRSTASNLVPNDTNTTNLSTADIFVHDVLTGVTTRVSVASDGTEGDSGSEQAFISANGRYVVFNSEATNLVPNDTNSIEDIFIHDTMTNETTRVSVASDGTEGNIESAIPSITPDGKYVIFHSLSTNLVPGDTNSAFDVFVHNTVTGVTTRVSVASDGTQGDSTGSFDGNPGALYPSISADGRYSVFHSDAFNLASGDNDNDFDVFVHDNVTEATALLSTTAANGEELGASGSASISADGVYVAFASNGFVFLTQNPLFSTNEAPVLASVGNKSVNENQTLTFTITATDPNSDALTYSATNFPLGATFDSQTATFSWTPSYAQAGNYDNIEFAVMDDGSPMKIGVELITITVGDVNRAPVFALVGSQAVLENDPLSFTVSATDPDGDNVLLAASSTPSGATFNAGTGTFSWIPTLLQAGVYVVTFTAVDDGVPSESSALEVVITVGDSPTPTEQAENIVDVVVDADLPSSVENSYLANLNKVAIFIEQGKMQPAINQLNAFIQKVQQDYAHDTITLAQRNSLVALAQNLIDALNGG